LGICNLAHADWLVSTYKAPEQIFALDQADAVAADSANRVGSGLYPTFNSEEQADYGIYPSGDKPPGLIVPDSDYFVVSGSGYLNVPATGDYKFALLDDDAGRLRLDGNAIITETQNHAAFYPQEVRYSALLHLSEGVHPIDVLYYEVTGYAGGEVFLVNPSDNSPIALVGDVAHGGMVVSQTTVPEPATLLGLALAGLFFRRARRINQTTHHPHRRRGWGC
jgi:hypothetical protein